MCRAVGIVGVPQKTDDLALTLASLPVFARATYMRVGKGGQEGRFEEDVMRDSRLVLSVCWGAHDLVYEYRGG